MGSDTVDCSLVARKTSEMVSGSYKLVPNAMPIEGLVDSLVDRLDDKNYNLLMINGPSVGKSQGRATPTTMGDSQ